ncbi:DUF3152 domain-containing protein [Streptomyces sp. NPDC014733]|uniref:DUF3152 domain-containing protein n=1 Tax=Streptomyces sp. NPDC014733 TaxID=3364885 RepID=UPI0036FC4BD5
MGRHSRGAAHDGHDTTETALPHAEGPGTGRRRRGPGDGEHPHPAESAARPRGAAHPGPAREGVRGGHPEQREPGGGWGLPPSVPGASAPGPPAVRRAASRPSAAGPRVPRPRAAAEPDMRLPDPATAEVRPGAGPRREYLEAFDALDVLDGPGAGAFPHGPAETGRSVVFARETEPADGGAPAGTGAPGVAGGPDAPPSAAAKKGGLGRTFTGVAAAAVTTVLAVVVAGQVAEQRSDATTNSGGGPDRTDPLDEGASRSADRPQDAKPASYAQRMAEPFPLDAKLTASGKFTPVGGAAKAPGRGHVVRYRVDMETGLPLDGELFADAVHKTLNDDRSWAHGGTRTFERVASGDADFVITLASPGTTDEWCAKSGLDTSEDNVSCDSAATPRVMINAYRWAQGAKTYGPDKMYAYRQMLINHEVGHRLGRNHEVCSRSGALAPVMMQQTKFLTTDGATCRPNSWPYPGSS